MSYLFPLREPLLSRDAALIDAEADRQHALALQAFDGLMHELRAGADATFAEIMSAPKPQTVEFAFNPKPHMSARELCTILVQLGVLPVSGSFLADRVDHVSAELGSAFRHFDVEASVEIAEVDASEAAEEGAAETAPVLQ